MLQPGASTTFTTSRNRRVSIRHNLVLLLGLRYTTPACNIGICKACGVPVLNVAGKDSVLSTTGLFLFHGREPPPSTVALAPESTLTHGPPSINIVIPRRIPLRRHGMEPYIVGHLTFTTSKQAAAENRAPSFTKQAIFAIRVFTCTNYV
jgi:hypothetical protein